MKVKKVKIHLDYMIKIFKPDTYDETSHNNINEIIQNDIIGKKYHHTTFPQVGNYYLDIKYLVDIGGSYQLIDSNDIPQNVSFDSGQYQAYPVQIFIQ